MLALPAGVHSSLQDLCMHDFVMAEGSQGPMEIERAVTLGSQVDPLSLQGLQGG